MKQLPPKKRTGRIIVSQVAIIATAFLGAFFLVSHDGNLSPWQWRNLWVILPALVLIKSLVFWRVNLFRGHWQFTSLTDFISLFKVNVMASLLVFLGMALFYGLPKSYWSIFLIDSLLCFLGLSGIRAAIRTRYEKRISGLNGQRTLIVGAGGAGQILVRIIRQSRKFHKKLVGFVDDDPDKNGLWFQGLPVLGPISALSEVVENYGVKLIIIAIPSAVGSQMQRIVAECGRCPVEVLTLPSLVELMQGKQAISLTINQLRKVKVEDLLGRQPVLLNNEPIALELSGQVIMVTGAGGSIGSEICRQVATFEPQSLVLFEQSEFNLYNLEKELVGKFPEIQIVPIIGDICDPKRIAGVMASYNPNIVYHAAAYKHVPLMETNALEAIKNNVLGTQIVATMATKHQVKKFVLISTDKAVHPTNVMGASKRAAELVLQTLDPKDTIFVAVRFGNVLGSSGSVIPLFERQIADGGPLTVTHPEVARYFMTIPEASGLVLQAASMGRGGEVFVLDMGRLVKIYDLAVNMVRLSGLEPGKDIEIKFTGLRPGEKMIEELLVAGEVKYPTDHEKIFVITQKNNPTIRNDLENLIACALKGNIVGTFSCLQSLVEGYTPSSELFEHHPCTFPSDDQKEEAMAAIQPARKI